ncbi:uncharacterized protein BDZ99DRAFT_129600 [Mytilinidion resinicola]|uniref:Uncharacterized protein n=1 Tax=Mytilinidion resinicola TaxID=574789 RepID=A0A6A6Z4T1_9PEZI|nr:uncharacterized protein BDZ99DRAFT_129600 [Mytilinidion resinicola]KAF2816142.1 hypothetical protein BDZ99DRAFT_129600 [Mytilinidion resinicola]
MWLPSTFTAQLPPSYSPHPVPALGSIEPDQAPSPSSSLTRLCASSAVPAAILVLARRSCQWDAAPSAISSQHLCRTSVLKVGPPPFTTSLPR